MDDYHYAVYYHYDGKDFTTYVERLELASGGFWVDSDTHHYTNGSDSWRWIPPHKIDHIDKEARWDAK